MNKPVRLLARAAALPLAVLAVGLGHAGPAQAAAWCGTTATDDRPAAVAGYQVRVVYYVASDGADQSATLAPQLSADVDAIETWWQAQDPTRTLRFDRAAFPCGPQADIELVRSQQTAATLSVTDTRFGIIVNDVLRLDGGAPFYKYLVYYDGPLDTNEICGQGGGSYDGPGVAIVYTGACAGEPTVATAAHEMLHAMGALGIPGAPGACPDDQAHVCDSSADILWPYASFTPLEAYVLDANRNDYYGHAGTWIDIQDSRWLRRLDAQTALSLTLTGSGTVRSDVPGVLCSVTCTTEWDTGSTVVLEAVPAANQRFGGWSGGCTGLVTVCSVTLAQPTAVTALFTVPTVALRVAVAGKGTVRGASGRIACPGRCTAAVSTGSPVRLTAVPAKGWRFKTWSGGCKGTRAVCALPMNAAASTRATFVRKK
jgi:hypothetical protein